MGSTEIVGEGRTYSIDLDLWLDDAGRLFIKNEFDPGNHVWIDISGDFWSVKTNTSYQIDWRKLSFPQPIESGFKRYLKAKLRINAPRFLGGAESAMNNISALLDKDIKSFSDFHMDTFTGLWKEMVPHYASWLREAYSWLAENDEPGTSYSIASKLKGMKIRNEVRSLKDVLNWHPTKGALTQEEEEQLKLQRQNSVGLFNLLINMLLTIYMSNNCITVCFEYLV